jgi:GH15 family glucan-1,4-alpha-glucosidase
VISRSDSPAGAPATAANRTAIGDYALIGDCRAAALVSSRGSIDWLCWPRFDSPSLFARILDEARGGSFSIAPAATFSSERAYLEGTNVLRTRFSAPGAELSLTDFMPVVDEHDLPCMLLPEHEIVRIARCERGELEVDVVFDPRPEYAAREIRMRGFGKLGLRAELNGALLSLTCNRPFPREGRARFRLRAGEELHFSLTWCTANVAVLPPTGERTNDLLEGTEKLWRSWSARTQYDGPGREAVVRSALVLKALQFAPSGAIIAAPTTSLPERPSGELNWDYRFCWLRDAALTSRALFGLGHHEEAQSFLSFLLSATNLTLPKLHVLYDLFGRKPPAERTLPHLEGHGGARPVRIGNAAMDQIQLDTYGEVIEAAAHFVRSGGKIDRAVGSMLVGFGHEVARAYDEPDEGIWEVRGLGASYTHSRVLCFTALARLIELQEKGHLRRAPVAKFRAAQEAIRRQIETLGWSEQLQSYTQTLSGSNVDASLLLLPWYGYCKADSPRMLATWRRIQRELGIGDGLLRRYLGGPLTRGEGAFGICSFWACEYLALGGGTVEEACAHFASLLRYANDVGLYGEEIEAQTGAALGNFPQAYTHVGLINAALSLRDRIERGKGETQRQHARVPEARS